MKIQTRTTASLLLLAGVASTGCGDLLTETPKAQIVTETFFQTPADATAAIYAAYQPLSTGGVFGTNLQWALNAATDESRVGIEEENPNIVALTQLRWDAKNPYVAGTTSANGPWSGLFTVITRSNLVLAKVPAIAMDETAKAQILGQAKFLRALGYLYLVRLYGDVTLVTTPEEQITVQERTPKEQVYAQIIKDATEAEAALPATWPATQKGLATKGSAEALLAEMYVWRSSAEQKSEWTQAATYAKKVIDLGVYDLTPNYIDAFLPGSQNRKEEVFAAQSSAVTGSPRIDIAAWTYPRNMDPNGAGGWGTYQPLPWFINSYTAGDYRQEATFFTTGKKNDGSTVTFTPHIYKFRPTTKSLQDVNFPIYRYADVLLMYAEALNETAQTPLAITYVNMVRARARKGTGSETRLQPADLAPTLTQAQTRDAIFQERQWELSFEGKRWFDMVRRGWPYFSAALLNDPTATDVQQTDMKWPIPQAQIDVNPKLTQNPGY
jgi:hypothetical protein